MRSHSLGREDLQKKKNYIYIYIIKGNGNLPELPGMGAAGVAETSTIGTAEAGAVGTAEKGTEGTTGMAITSAAGAGIPTPAAIPGPSKLSASREIGVQMKCKYT